MAWPGLEYCRRGHRAPQGFVSSLTLALPALLFLVLARQPLPTSGLEPTSSTKPNHQAQARGAAPGVGEKGPQGASVSEEGVYAAAEELFHIWREEVATAAAEELYQAWADMFALPGLAAAPYNLTSKGPAAVEAPPSFTVAGAPHAFPWPPHLEECSARAEFRRALEQHPPGQGAYPEWACASAGAGGNVSFCASPAPPWVRGADADNLPKTRVAQRDIWVHQFSRECSGPDRAGGGKGGGTRQGVRFMIAQWGSYVKRGSEMLFNGGGMGAELHFMTVAFDMALRSGRVLVPVGYGRAAHRGCTEHNAAESFDCYFFPTTSGACREQALSYAVRSKGLPNLPGLKSIMDPDVPVVYIGHKTNAKGRAPVADRWISNLSDADAPFALLGRSWHGYALARANWWRSQALRFLMRWPSAYLCHATNQVRHRAFGMEVARRAVLSMLDAARLAASPGVKLAGDRYPLAEPLDRTPRWRLQREPYVPRPMASIHVRQGDKAKEMTLFPFKAYMWLANQLRLMDPSASNVWLSTEMQSVIDETTGFNGWRFYFTSNLRQRGATAMWAYEAAEGLENHVGLSFANLVIASQCDYFIGVLGSNWNRVINELRLTNGRIEAQYLTLNVGEY